MSDPITEARLQASLVATIAYHNILPYGKDERGGSDPDVSSFERFLSKVRIARRSIRAVDDSLLETKADRLPVRSGAYSGKTFHHVALQFADRVAGAIIDWLGGWGSVENGIDDLEFRENWISIKSSLSSVSIDIDLAEVKAGIDIESAAMKSVVGATPLPVSLKDLEYISARCNHRIKVGTMNQTPNKKDRPDPIVNKPGIANQFWYNDCIEWFRCHENWPELPDENTARDWLANKNYYSSK